jgi:hypothetical protein
VGLWLPVYASSDLNPGRFYLRKFTSDANSISAVVGYEGQSGLLEVASFRVMRADHARNQSYRLVGQGQFQSVVGVVVVGKFDSLDSQPYGSWEFDPDDGRLDPTCIQLIPQCVESLTLVNDGVSSAPLTGPLELNMGANMQAVAIIGQGTPRFRLNAVSASGFEEPCICEGDEAEIPCIRTINGVPSVNGNLELLGNDCAAVQSTATGLVINNSCCSPCCGCPELEKITEDLRAFESERQIWLNFVQGLGTQVQTLSLHALGAKLGDRGCVTCD